jgi:hypothetical protein
LAATVAAKDLIAALGDARRAFHIWRDFNFKAHNQVQLLESPHVSHAVQQEKKKQS